jgi:hypothetical protein
LDYTGFKFEDVTLTMIFSSLEINLIHTTIFQEWRRRKLVYLSPLCEVFAQNENSIQPHGYVLVEIMERFQEPFLRLCVALILLVYPALEVLILKQW